MSRESEILESALEAAYELLKKPYKGQPQARYPGPHEVEGVSKDKLEALTQADNALEVAYHQSNSTADVQNAMEQVERAAGDLYGDQAYVNRENHALAHHIRGVHKVQPVIDYFAEYAQDEPFKTFCRTMTNKTRLATQIMMAFSRTGRESELGFFEDPDQYKKFQQQSVEHCVDFMRGAGYFSDARSSFINSRC